ncbi:Tim44-like domain protein [Sphingomonas jeddahensis]|uniref:Tim44-like domain protein n=2 Tax=Sphingomonas jeddahensis TaxID=1915074 RepID=A0A1V2ESW5_9SPHN|nr:Tim44-like domain protein [Sphingomonas jeddahensis]
MIPFKSGNLGVIAASLAIAALTIVPDDADARRKGSFGSRGARTYNAPAPTAVAPKQTAPVQRSMTEKSAARTPAQAQAGRAASANRGGMAKGLIGGLIAGGLIGALLGGGLGSLAGAGMLMALLQITLIGGLVWLLLRMFRRRPALAGAHGGAMSSPFAGFEPRSAPQRPSVRSFPAVAAAPRSGEIDIDNADRQDFERLLVEVQDAFSKEDFGRLRERTTPEVMSYFAEELSQNATAGRRNSVSGTVLIDAEVAEAWREDTTDYATIAMRYESVDVMLDRSTGAVLEGDAERPSQATELWTFKRESHGEWRLSAVQEA